MTMTNKAMCRDFIMLRSISTLDIRREEWLEAARTISLAGRKCDEVMR